MVTAASVCVTPLTTTVGVKVLALGPLLINVTVALTVVPAIRLPGKKTSAPRSDKPASDTVAPAVLLAKLSSGQLATPVDAATVVDVPPPSNTVVTDVTEEFGASVTGANVVVRPSTTSVGVKVAVTRPGLLNVTVADTVVPGRPDAGSCTEIAKSAGGTIAPDSAAAVLLALTASVGVKPLAIVKATPLPPA